MIAATVGIITVSITLIVLVLLGINETRKEIKEVDKWEPKSKK